MIIVKLFGGLGNQLFQYAIGRKLSLLHNTELRFDLTDFYKYKNLYTNMSVVGVDIKKFKVNFNEEEAISLLIRVDTDLSGLVY